LKCSRHVSSLWLGCENSMNRPTKTSKLQDNDGQSQFRHNSISMCRGFKCLMHNLSICTSNRPLHQVSNKMHLSLITNNPGIWIKPLNLSTISVMWVRLNLPSRVCPHNLTRIHCLRKSVLFKRLRLHLIQKLSLNWRRSQSKVSIWIGIRNKWRTFKSLIPTIRKSSSSFPCQPLLGPPSSHSLEPRKNLKRKT
jgi:hypothetical protein